MKKQYQPRYSDGQWVAICGAIGEKIRELREAEGLSCLELAQAVGTSSSTIQKIERDGTSCPLRLLVSLADHFDVTLDELVPVQVAS